MTPRAPKSAFGAPLREEHAVLRRRLDAVEDLAITLPILPRVKVLRELADALEFLTAHVTPHALAEEAILYPVIDQIAGSSETTVFMRAEHAEILGRIESLKLSAVRSQDAVAYEIEQRQLRLQLPGLSAILRMHLDVEENVLFPILEASLSEEEAARLLEEMVTAAHNSFTRGFSR
ncbi:MAG TPA: hemerythrin domain-containing protein [Acidimicrobiia bacterium]|nr:hemerythrin domain-containing protein [Acidimicrobiia bacterium]